MARFDVYANADAHSRRLYPFLLEVQADLLRDLPTTVVIPLALPAAIENLPASDLNPEFTVASKRLLAMTQELSAIQRRALGKRTMSLVHEQHRILAALDLLLSGY
jgi:toxin CcdB